MKKQKNFALQAKMWAKEAEVVFAFEPPDQAIACLPEGEYVL